MKTERPYAKVAITPKGENALLQGHPWVYEGEILSTDGEIHDGDLVDVCSRRGSYLGTAFYNSHSMIRCQKAASNLSLAFRESRRQRIMEWLL